MSGNRKTIIVKVLHKSPGDREDHETKDIHQQTNKRKKR